MKNTSLFERVYERGHRFKAHSTEAVSVEYLYVKYIK